MNVSAAVSSISPTQKFEFFNLGISFCDHTRFHPFKKMWQVKKSDRNNWKQMKLFNNFLRFDFFDFFSFSHLHMYPFKISKNTPLLKIQKNHVPHCRPWLKKIIFLYVVINRKIFIDWAPKCKPWTTGATQQWHDTYNDTRDSQYGWFLHRRGSYRRTAASSHKL